MSIHWKNIYNQNKSIFWAAGVAIILTLGILWKIPDEVTRFTLIMPIFAGFILFAILTTDDDELEDKDSVEKKETKKEEKIPQKRKLRNK